MMSERNQKVQLDHLIDDAVNAFLSVSDGKVLERVKELTGDENSVARDFDRRMRPILNQYKADHGRDIPAESTEGLGSATWTVLRWDSIHYRIRSLFSRPMRSALAALTVVVAGATLSVPFWRAAQDGDSSPSYS
ncbi:hypothetical protein ACFLEY_08485 [Bradyrhizobium sp. YCK136]|uniref:hypothetical protein n=1 Tax=Bradyrhizobium TaxID=374 RepID=UPI001B8D8D15|nr:hypothetical protein [Bradyrhizobium diazoefficiens]MBR0868680.1 hypothetical protein [Bradyrhizobium diazoefficiens]MBR0893264.1 hypothetical protein [Bradyrhizobium diazoefficiens]MBR0924963.1 hypothetical protein [Bradyrhizobium diazoefficiens]